MHSQQEQQYLDLLQKLILHGKVKTDRTGTGTLSKFGHQMRFNLAEGFPLLTTKKVHFKSILTELLWFLKGDTNIQYLLKHDCTIWTKGEMHSDDIIASGFDQISWLINEIKINPDSRRLIIAGWNPHEVTQVDLPPCHTLFQFAVETLTETERRDLWEKKKRRSFGSFYDPKAWKSYAGWEEYFDSIMFADGIPAHKLSCQLYQRSADTFLGVSFNIASYALLMHIVAHYTGMAVGDFVWTGGDVHLYRNHTEQAALQLTREGYLLPQIKLNIPAGVSFDQLEHDHFTLENYQSHPPIKADVAV